MPLSDPAGMSRLGVSLIRLPPGKESFIPHAHTLAEEFVFVLEGAGRVILDGEPHPIGPGDFIGFPTDGVVHSLACSGPSDLVYLTGGERIAVEVADMPTIGRTAIFRRGGMELLETGSGETLTQSEWMARTKIADPPS